MNIVFSFFTKHAGTILPRTFRLKNILHTPPTNMFETKPFWVRYTFIQMRKKKNSSKNTFVQKHFHPKALSSKNTFVQNQFVQNRRQFHPRHFHPKTVSSNDIFIQNHFHPNPNFELWTLNPKHLNNQTTKPPNTKNPKNPKNPKKPKNPQNPKTPKTPKTPQPQNPKTLNTYTQNT